MQSQSLAQSTDAAKIANAKKNEIDCCITPFFDPIPLIHALPDPHVERWLLIDSQAFKAVFGKGCKAPDQKCEKYRYKTLLREAIENAGGNVLLGGLEHAEDLVKAMSFDTLKNSDNSIKRFIIETEQVLKSWKLI